MDYVKNKFMLLLLIFTSTVKDTIGLQRFAEQPKYTEVNPGQDALLTCKIIDKRGTCSWQKDNKPIGIYPKKYEWAGGSLSLQGIQSSHIGGDCSLWIRSATLDYDDGLWECQVTASDFTTQDALTSQPVRLVVRVAPQRPRLEHEGVHVLPGHNVTVDSDAVATVKCVSHYGNPPALLKWFLGDQELSALHPQTNATEPDNPRTWSAASVVQVPSTRDRHGTSLKCLALHESYAAKSVSVEARMDVKYAPTIRLMGAPQIDLEEGKDFLVLRCEADANPPASIVWRRAGRSEIASLQESLQLRPVGRRDAGLYTCQAQNSVGTSEALSVQLDIKYPPRILSAGPDRLTTAPLFSPAAFECVAEGNPPPTFKWLQRRSQESSYVERGRESRLVIDNVTYDYQGEYECRASNFINGQERTVSSESITLQVVGAPQVLRLNPSLAAVSVRKGDSAALSLVVCADPRPRHVAWEWGSLRLEAGAGIGRYRVDEVTHDSREDCYLATLHIIEADLQDARPYYLVVENERGVDRHAIHLSVEEPLELSYLLGIAGGCLAALLLLICLCIYAVRAKKCCFKRSDAFKTSEKDSEKADLKSRSDSSGGPQLDSIYTTPAGFHHHQHHHHHSESQGSPEAMKSTTQNGLRNPASYTTTPIATTTMTKTALSTLNNNISNADLILGSQRHQRDLFTGSLGIPDVTTHVGSVIHAFETMAQKRSNNLVQKGEKPYELLPSAISTSSYRSWRKQSLSDPIISNSNNNSMKKMKKDIESMHKIVLATPSNTPLNAKNFYHPNNRNHYNLHHEHQQQQRNSYTKSGELFHGPENENDSSNFDSIHMDDYRKNLFGTQPKRKNRNTSPIISDRNTNQHHHHHYLHQQHQSLSDNNNFKDIEKSMRSATVADVTYRRSSEFDTGRNVELSYQVNNNNNYSHQIPSVQRPSHDNNDSGGGNLDDDDDDSFLRGTTVSQSFIKNVRSSRKKFTGHDQNNESAATTVGGGTMSSTSNGFKRDRNTATITVSTNNNKNQQQKRNRLMHDVNLGPDELGVRYIDSHNSKNIFNSNNNNNTVEVRGSKRKIFKPRTIDRAEI